MQKKITVAISDDMLKALEREAKRLKFASVQDVARFIFADYFKDNGNDVS
jgi:hypothetical protein